MNELEEFLLWAKKTRESLDSVINKIEEKIEFDDDDYEFIEDAFIAYEQGSL
jgi:hypothetical protein